MAESWEDLPDIEAPKSVPVVKVPKPKSAKSAPWESLPDAPALSDPYAGQKKDYEVFKKEDEESKAAMQPAVDALVGDMFMPKPEAPPPIPTLSQGDPNTFIKPPSAPAMERTHLEAVKDTPIIPGMEGTSPSSVRAALGSASLNTAPYALAAMDDRPFEVGLKDWHSMYMQAQEDHPVAAFMGGVATPMPFAKAALPVRAAAGYAAGYLSGWLGTDPDADKMTKSKNADESAKFGAAMFALAPPIVNAAVKAMKGSGFTPKIPPPRISVATPEFVTSLKDSLSQVPTKKPWTTPDPNVVGEKITKVQASNSKELFEMLGRDPAAIQTEAVPDLKSMKPFAALIGDSPDGMVGRVFQNKGGKLLVHEVKIDDAPSLYKFKQAMVKFHPDIDVSPHGIVAGQKLLADDAMREIMYPKKVTPENQAPVVPPKASTVADTQPGSPQRSLSGRNESYIRPVDEAPIAPATEPQMIVDDGTGSGIQLFKLDSPAAKGSSLRSRHIIEVSTPEGPRYVMNGGHEADGKIIVMPFDTAEGIPTIAEVSRVSRSKLKDVDDDVLLSLVKNHQTGKATSTPNIGEGGSKFTPEQMQDAPPTRVDTPAPPPLPQWPEPLPPSGPPVPPPPGNVHEFQIMEKVGNMNPLKRQLIHASQRAELDLANHISDITSAKNIEKQKFAIYNAMSAKMGAKKYADFRRDVGLAFEGKITEAQLEGMYADEVFVPKRKILSEAIAKRDANDAWFRENGYLEAIESDLDPTAWNKYVNREYAATTLPAGEYAKIVKNDETKMALGVAGFKNWALKQGREIGDVEARSLVMEVLGSKDPMTVLDPSKGGGGSKATGAMKKREDLPEWYRTLLGENRDGFHMVARTIAKQEFLKHSYQVYEQIAVNPKWMKPRGALVGSEGETWQRMPEDTKLYGKAAGMMAHPFVHDALVTLPNVPSAADGIAAAIYSVMKTNQMGFPSARTLMNMAGSNLEAGIMAGGMDPTRPVASAKAMLYANRAMYEFKKDPLASNEFSTFIRDARRIGADAPGHIGLDLNAMQQRTMDDVTKHMVGYKGKLDFKEVWGAAMRAHKWAAKPGSVAIDWFDRNQKLTSWHMITKELEAKGFDHETAMRMAYRRVAAYNPMFDRLPPLAERMRSGLIGAGSPYSSYGMERNRIYAGLPRRFAESVQDGAEDPGLPFRALKWGVLGGALFGGGYAAGRRYLGNVSDEDVTAAMANREGTAKGKFNPAPWVWPYRDPSNGKVTVMDMTGWSGALTFMQGDQTLSPLALIALNTVRGPLQDGWIGEGVDAVLEEGGIKMGMGPNRPPQPWETTGDKVAGVADFLAKRGGAPRTPQDIYARMQETEGGSMRQENQSMGTSGLKAFLGAPVEGQQSVGLEGANPSLFNQVKMHQGAIANIQAAMSRLALMPPDQRKGPLQRLYDMVAKGTPTEEKKDAFKRLGKMIKEDAMELAKVGKANRAAREAKRKRDESEKIKSEKETNKENNP